MPQDTCYHNKPHKYEPAGSITIGSGEENQQLIPIQVCSMCGEQSPSELEIAGMDAEERNVRSLERKLVPDSSRESHQPASTDTHSHFDAF